MNENYKTLVKVYAYKGEEFTIVKGLHDGIIRAINHKYIDSNGLLTKPLNGFEMFVNTANNTINGVINQINMGIDWQEYIKENNVDISNSDELLKAVAKFYGLS